MFNFLTWIHSEQTEHCTDFELLRRVDLQIGQTYLTVGPGFNSIPARNNNILTSPAGVYWSVLKKASRGISSLVRKLVEDFASRLLLGRRLYHV